jgi:hypothetical protein
MTKVFETDIPLPAAYKELRHAIFETYKSYYPGAMTELFNEAPKYLEGPNNRYLLYQSVRFDFPELAFVDKNDSQWKISDLRVQTFDLPDDGSLIQAEVSEFLMLKIRRPKSIALEKINTDPRTIMDTYLSGTSLERTLGGSGKYRILSLGDPVRVTEYRDNQGRIWLKTWWLLEFADAIMLVYILPMPNGPVVFMTRQGSGSRHIYEWDMEAVCDRIFVGYRGNMEEWSEFLSMKKWISDTLAQVSFAWNEGEKNLNLAMPQLSLKVGKPVFDWTSQSSLVLAPAYYLKNEAIEYGIRSLVLERDIKGNDYFIIQQHVKPDEKLGAKILEQWNDIKAAKYPFDGQSRLSDKDNTGSIGGLLTQPGVLKDVQYSLYLGMDDPGNVDALSTRYKALTAGIEVLK